MEGFGRALAVEPFLASVVLAGCALRHVPPGSWTSNPSSCMVPLE